MNFSSAITCPQCHHEFSLSDEFQKDLEQKMKKDMNEQQQKWNAEKEKLEKEKQKAEEIAKEKYEKTLQQEKLQLWEKAQKVAIERSESKFLLQLKDLESQNEENRKKLQESQQKELDFLKKERELEEKSRNIELEMQKKLQTEIMQEKIKIEDDIKKNLSEEHRLKLLEKDKQMEQLKKSLDDAQRRADQGSMQIQGDVQEDDLRDMLRGLFPLDLIEDVPTGIRGADIIQTVKNNMGQSSGIILWESKNTKSWTEGWIQKLKDDQANLGADIAILVSKTLPEGVEQYEFRNGVWVVGYAFVNSLISLLRFHILELGSMKTSLQGKDEKMNMLYEYLSSPQFKNRIENIVDAFSSMKSDLDAEKRAFQKHWNKREKQLERVMMNTSGFYGDLQGIAGNSLLTVDALELPE